MLKIRIFRIWSLFFLGIALRVLPERVKGQHRAGEIAVWVSSYPRMINR